MDMGNPLVSPGKMSLIMPATTLFPTDAYKRDTSVKSQPHVSAKHPSSSRTYAATLKAPRNDDGGDIRRERLREIQKRHETSCSEVNLFAPKCL